MLLTDLLLKDSTPATRRFFNALAEEPETVAAVLVPQASKQEADDPVLHMCGRSTALLLRPLQQSSLPSRLTALSL